MPRRIINKLNRCAFIHAPAPVDVGSFAAVDLRIDPSQQLNITGFNFGYNLNFSDQTNILNGLMVGYLDITVNLDDPATSFTSTIPFEFGEFIYLYELNRDQGEFADIDFGNPLVIPGDRRATFVLYFPQISGGITGEVSFFIEVRGYVTNLENSNRIGSFVLNRFQG